MSQGGETVDIPVLGAEINDRQVITSLLLVFMGAFLLLQAVCQHQST